MDTSDVSDVRFNDAVGLSANSADPKFNLSRLSDISVSITVVCI